MQSQSTEHEPVEAPNVIFHSVPGYSEVNYSATEELSRTVNEPIQFHSRFDGRMDMCADASTVAAYLDTHQDWFCRCAHPMRVDPLGANGYALVIGRFGSFGYEVEPKIGLNLLPQEQGVYRIETIPVPGYVPPGYDVDFQAALELVDCSPQADQLSNSQPEGSKSAHQLTQVEWTLELAVTIQFPRFIHSLPKPLVQKTGDRLLAQIVRQVSRRLTQKVQEDFHKSLHSPFPKHSKKHFFWQTASNPTQTDDEGNCSS